MASRALPRIRRRSVRLVSRIALATLGVPLFVGPFLGAKISGAISRGVRQSVEPDELLAALRPREPEGRRADAQETLRRLRFRLVVVPTIQLIVLGAVALATTAHWVPLPGASPPGRLAVQLRMDRGHWFGALDTPRDVLRRG